MESHLRVVVLLRDDPQMDLSGCRINSPRTQKKKSM